MLGLSKAGWIVFAVVAVSGLLITPPGSIGRLAGMLVGIYFLALLVSSATSSSGDEADRDDPDVDGSPESPA